MCSGPDCDFVEIPLGVSPRQEETAPDSPSTATPSRVLPRSTKMKERRERKPNSQRESNLPSYYEAVDRSQFSASEKAVFTPVAAAPKLTGVTTGDIFTAMVEQAIKASPSVTTPIRAVLTSGGLKGAFLIGTARLDRELKRVLLTFTKLRTPDLQVYKINATGLSPDGRVGLEGDFHSETGKFFVAELAAATAAAIADSTIQRQQTTVGGWVQEPSLSNYGKQGAVAALSKSAERVAESVRSAPEWTEIAGYQEIKIIVDDEPTEGGN